MVQGRSQGHGYLSGKYFEIKTESIRIFLKLQRWHQLQILKTIWFQFEFQNFFSCDDSKCTVKYVDYRALQLQHWILYDRYIVRKNCFISIMTVCSLSQTQGRTQWRIHAWKETRESVSVGHSRSNENNQCLEKQMVSFLCQLENGYWPKGEYVQTWHLCKGADNTFV